MRHKYLTATVVAASILFAGCVGSGAELYAFADGGTPSDRQDSFEVKSGKAHLSVSAGGSGKAVVTITDAEDNTVYSKTFGEQSTGGSAYGGVGGGSAQGGADGNGGSAQTQSISGKAGTWTVKVDYQNYQGGFTLSITSA